VDRNVEPDVNDPDLAYSRGDVRKAYSARRYDYWLGGKDNFAADRLSGDEVEVVFPTIRLSTNENRRFLRRAVQFLIVLAGFQLSPDLVGVGADEAPRVAVTAAAHDLDAMLAADPGHEDVVRGESGAERCRLHAQAGRGRRLE
jgi:S-adenosyl methyltransferase